MDAAEIRGIVETQRAYFRSGKTLPVSARREALGRLRAAMEEYRPAYISSAVRAISGHTLWRGLLERQRSDPKLSAKPKAKLAQPCLRAGKRKALASPGSDPRDKSQSPVAARGSAAQRTERVRLKGLPFFALPGSASLPLFSAPSAKAASSAGSKASISCSV